MATYILFNKPYRVLPSFTDPDYERDEIEAPRETLGDFIPIEGLHPAGRLDYDSEGLLFLTDDGKLSHRLTHPDYQHSKRYLAQVEHIPDEAALERLRQGGIPIKNYRTAPAEVSLLPDEPALWPRHPPIRERANIPAAWLAITLTEGKKRQVRRMTAAVGHPTLRLVRVAIGPLELGPLSPGEWRHATEGEIGALRAIRRHRSHKRPQGKRSGRRGRRNRRR